MKRIAMIAELALVVAVPALMAAQEPPPPPPPQYQPPPPPPPQYQEPPPAPQYQPPPPPESRWDHGEVGVYADYLRFNPASYSDNYVGVGGRVALNMNPWVALEAEMNYDFARNFTSTNTTGTSSTTTTTFVTTSVRPLTGLFGPKLQFGRSSPFRAFVEGKVGFIDFSTNTSGVVSGSTFTGEVSGVGNGGTHVAFFPGGGIEGFVGPLGLRLDVGDEIYLNNGTYNNLRVTFGPTLRF
jgi:hypothetical protein